MDSTFDFEKRRNAPVKYDRNLMTATIRAMKRVSEVKAKREQRFFEKRMLVRKKHEKARNKVDISQGIDLVRPAAARKAEEVNVAEAVMDVETLESKDAAAAAGGN